MTHEGVTPFMIKCRASFNCDGQMQSSMYRVFDQNMAETYQWYKPASLEDLRPGEIEHVKKGGLLLRKVEQAEIPE